MIEYPKEFQSFWAIYGSPKNSSKSDALKAWNQTRKYHPRQDLMLASVEAYNNWLAAEQSKNGNGFPAKCHAATWLRGLRFEGFLDDAEAILRARDGHSKAGLYASSESWNDGPWASLMAVYDGDVVALDHWLGIATFVPGHPATIVSPSQFHRDELEKRFGKVIRQAFGQDVQLTVAKKSPS